MRTSKVKVSHSYIKAIVFIVLFTALAVFVVIYFGFSKVLITIAPRAKEVQTEFIVDVVTNQINVNNFNIKGEVKEEFLEKNESFSATGTKVIEPYSQGSVIGKAILYNTTDEQMQLVATTRLLTAANELFRIKDKAIIPAGGSVEVEIYPDKPDIFKELEAGTLTVPGLSEQLQSVVYAKVSQKITKERRTVTVITKEDIDAAVNDLSMRLIQDKLTELKLKQEAAMPATLALKGEVFSSVTDKQVGSEASQFVLTVKMKIVSVILDKEQIYKKLDEELQKLINPGEKLVGLDFDKTAYNIEKYDAKEGLANVKVSAFGKVVIDKDNNILEKSKVVGSTAAQVKKYYEIFDEVESAQVEFYPPFLKRVPSMLDHIEIIIR